MEAALETATSIEAEREQEPPEEAFGEESWRVHKSARTGGRWKEGKGEGKWIREGTTPSTVRNTIVRAENWQKEELREALLAKGLDSGDIDTFLDISVEYMNARSEEEPGILGVGRPL